MYRRCTYRVSPPLAMNHCQRRHEEAHFLPALHVAEVDRPARAVKTAHHGPVRAGGELWRLLGAEPKPFAAAGDFGGPASGGAQKDTAEPGASSWAAARGIFVRAAWHGGGSSGFGGNGAFRGS
jgi:hypothetical protein